MCREPALAIVQGSRVTKALVEIKLGLEARVLRWSFLKA